MTYLLNLHSHVKIWLSKDKDIFLPILNQLRLVRMRSINSVDEIHFIYDSHLLSSNARDQLSFFCAKYNLISHDIPTEIVPLCITEEERSLILLYQDEIIHLTTGGNLGAASDYIRWLSPIYKLGIYSDFDVDVDTRRLPQYRIVQHPILFNIGSGLATTLQLSDNYAQINFNNNIIVVVDPIAALADIQKVQRNLYNGSTKPQNGITPYRSSWNALKQELNNALGWRQWFSEIKLEGLKGIEFLILLDIISRNLSARETRSKIQQLTANNDSFCHSFFKRFCKDSDSSEHIARFREYYRYELTLDNVRYTSGPVAVRAALFKKLYTSKEITENIAPRSLVHYDLDKIFPTECIETFFHNRSDDINSKPKKKKSDLSWLEDGVRDLKIFEIKVKASARNMQRIFRATQKTRKSQPEEVTAHMSLKAF